VITAWRIAKARYAAHAFDGEGARRYGGRWNSIGTPMVYTSDYLATAVLELIVNMLDYSAVFKTYSCIAVEIPSRLITELDPEKLPANWQDNPPPASTRELGDSWIRNRASAVLKAPSAILPQHASYLINPYHPDFSIIKIDAPRPFKFDPRFNKP
jgi:RES domain-containing protein